MQQSKRRYERVDLVNEVYFEQNQKDVLAHWTDISLGGVFIQTSKPYSRDEQVKMRIRIEGEFFRAIGIVRHSLSRVGMGLEFTHLHPKARRSIEYFSNINP